jgi:hypothetical protein
MSCSIFSRSGSAFGWARPGYAAARAAFQDTWRDEGASYAKLPGTHVAAQKSTIAFGKHFTGNAHVQVDFCLDAGHNPGEGVQFINVSDFDSGGPHSYINISRAHDARTIRQGPAFSSDHSGDLRERGEGTGGNPGGGGSQGGGQADLFNIPGYSAVEHSRIFSDAVRRGKFNSCALRFLAEGDPHFESIAGKVLPEDRPALAEPEPYSDQGKSSLSSTARRYDPNQSTLDLDGDKKSVGDVEKTSDLVKDNLGLATFEPYRHSTTLSGTMCYFTGLFRRVIMAFHRGMRGVEGCAVQGLNLRPLQCQCSALPLS